MTLFMEIWGGAEAASPNKSLSLPTYLTYLGRQLGMALLVAENVGSKLLLSVDASSCGKCQFVP